MRFDFLSISYSRFINPPSQRQASLTFIPCLLQIVDPYPMLILAMTSDIITPSFVLALKACSPLSRDAITLRVYWIFSPEMSMQVLILRS